MPIGERPNILVIWVGVPGAAVGLNAKDPIVRRTT